LCLSVKNAGDNTCAYARVIVSGVPASNTASGAGSIVKVYDCVLVLQVTSVQVCACAIVPPHSSNVPVITPSTEPSIRHSTVAPALYGILVVLVTGVQTCALAI